MTNQPTGPAWQPPTPPTPPTLPPAANGRPPHGRGRTALVAVAAAGLGVGGLLVASQFASADEPSTAPASTTPDTTAPPGDTGDDTTPDDSTGVPPFLGGIDAGAVGECVADHLGIELPADGGLPGLDQLGQLGELTPDQLTAAWEACRSLLPDDVERSVDDLATCLGGLTDQLPMPDGSTPHGDGGVTVMTPDELSVLEFGAGDGTVTITKTGDEYAVTTSGDVHDVDLSAIDEQFDELLGEVQGALAECDITLPGGLGQLDLSQLLPGD